MQHSPQKVLVDSQRIVCLTKPNQITLTHCSLSHKIVFPLPPEHTIHTQIPVTCIKSGFSHTLGTNFIGTMVLSLHTLHMVTFSAVLGYFAILFTDFLAQT